MSSAAPSDARDSGSFGALYAEVAPTLAAWADLRTRGALRAYLEPADLVQEVVCRAFQKFPTFDPARGAFRRWIFGVANNILRETLAAAARPGAAAVRLEVSSGDLLDQLPDDVTSVSRRVARDEGFRAFVAKLKDLDDDERRLLIHRGLEGMDHAEVSAVLGISRDAAEKRWQRLLRRLEEMRPPADLFVR
ncbi:MAG TPA: sigma-70 family RNA polymerase sigma factor [Planctomycetota bacterium]|nr:sigma-70 family RNA polymerase sigma factor [Planctomycetota bacterium]